VKGVSETGSTNVVRLGRVNCLLLPVEDPSTSFLQQWGPQRESSGEVGERRECGMGIGRGKPSAR
jgi:hypothetical protein